MNMEATKRIIEENTLLPEHYTKMALPVYDMNKSYSIRQLENMIENFKEYGHQLRIRYNSIFQEFRKEFDLEIKSISDLLPDQTPIPEPSYHGAGNHFYDQLVIIALSYQDFCKQLEVIEKNVLTKLNITLI